MMAVIKSSPVDGKGLFTFKDYEAGQGLLVIERPLIAVLDAERLEDTCSSCFAWTGDSIVSQRSDGKAVEVKACNACKILKYCSKVW